MVFARDHDPVPVAPGLDLPVQCHKTMTLAHTGAVCLLVANGTLFASLLFGVGFLSVVAPGWPAPWPVRGGMPEALLIGAIVLAIAIGMLAARFADAARRRAKPVFTGAGAGLAANLVALALVGWLTATALDDPAGHARDALRGVLAGYVGLHAFIVAGFAAFANDQARRGEIACTRPGSLRGWRLWQDYTAATTLIAACVVLWQGGAA